MLGRNQKYNNNCVINCDYILIALKKMCGKIVEIYRWYKKFSVI